ncbi:hypothetical protein TWF718_004223 [Orbilia javanica]|uniref:Uncharacterized protein n=1 Tax=Orbilia javanica TaxID=47235 RepID=A0AAN8MUR0_9PEZI
METPETSTDTPLAEYTSFEDLSPLERHLIAQLRLEEGMPLSHVLRMGTDDAPCPGSGWLGFTNDPGETTYYMGYISMDDQRLICRDKMHTECAMFCVRKRDEAGFQILMLGGKDSLALWPLGTREDGQISVVRGSKDWWGFERTA